MGRTGNLKSHRGSTRQRSITKAKVSVVDTLKRQNKVWSFDQQVADSHLGRILILLGDVRRNTSVANSKHIVLLPPQSGCATRDEARRIE
jgi:hypothetical protein